jgi:NADH:ubiquinone oxidoreductase subunit E
VEAVNSTVQSYLDKHNREKRALIAILQDIQAAYNYLPREALEAVAGSLKIPLIDVIGVATFYRAFSLKPRGRHLVTVCLGTACHVRGGPKILSEFEKRLAVEPGETTPDKQFTLETVACLGCCAIGPVVVVDGTYHAQTTTGKVDAILRKYAAKKKGKK